MKKMLVLLNRPEDIDGHLVELKEMVKTQGIAKMNLARILRAFGSRTRSIVAPHKLDMAARMSDAAASKYLSKIANYLRTEGIDVEPIGTGITAVEIDEFIRRNDIDLIVTTHGHSELHQRLTKGFTIDADAVSTLT